jgi:hypothetical protein
MIYDFFLARRPHNGKTYETYFEEIKRKVEDEKSANNIEAKDSHSDQIKLNFQRLRRITKAYTVDSELLSIIQRIKEPQLWMVLTEDWCGDSSQILPYLATMAAGSPLIDFRILLRDENLDIMDLYLTNLKSRSIPKLVTFDNNGNELFQWGPRPIEAEILVNKLKEEGMLKDEFMKKLHLWYAQNSGKAIEDEFKNILGKLI